MLNASISFSFLARHQGLQKKVIWVFQTNWSKPSALAGQLSPKKLTLIVEIFALSYPPGNPHQELPCGCLTGFARAWFSVPSCSGKRQSVCLCWETTVASHDTLQEKNTYNRSAVTIATTRAPRMTRLDTIHKGADNFLSFVFSSLLPWGKVSELEGALRKERRRP